MNSMIRRKLIKVKRPPRSIEQWYKRVLNLDRLWKENRQKEERLQKRRK